jgi:hypothetical protein
MLVEEVWPRDNDEERLAGENVKMAAARLRIWAKNRPNHVFAVPAELPFRHSKAIRLEEPIVLALTGNERFCALDFEWSLNAPRHKVLARYFGSLMCKFLCVCFGL